MKTFKEYSRSITEGNINKENWNNLKAFMKKQPGFDSWSFEGFYDELVIGFKTQKQASNAVKKSNDSSLEIGAFGSEVSVENGIVTVYLSDDAKEAMDQ